AMPPRAGPPRAAGSWRCRVTGARSPAASCAPAASRRRTRSTDPGALRTPPHGTQEIARNTGSIPLCRPAFRAISCRSRARRRAPLGGEADAIQVRGPHGRQLVPVVAADAYTCQAQEFVHAIQEEREPSAGRLQDALAAVRLAWAAKQSVATGEVTSLAERDG